MRLLGVVVMSVLVLGSVAARADDTSGCAKFKWPITREATAFGSSVLPTIVSGQSVPGVMEAVSVTLMPQGGVTFAMPPGKKPKVDPAYAAVLPMPPLAADGTYQVTLSAEGWIDVMQDGKSIKSAGFSGQPDCPGVRKSVKFFLRAGPATIQISGVATDTIKIEVLPAE